MSKYFSEEEICILELNPYTKKVSFSTITYIQEFRGFFIDEYEKRSTPTIFSVKPAFILKYLVKSASTVCAVILEEWQLEKMVLLIPEKDISEDQ